MFEKNSKPHSPNNCEIGKSTKERKKPLRISLKMMDYESGVNLRVLDPIRSYKINEVKSE